jgi:hypothetical protein
VACFWVPPWKKLVLGLRVDAGHDHYDIRRHVVILGEARKAVFLGESRGLRLHLRLTKGIVDVGAVARLPPLMPADDARGTRQSSLPLAGRSWRHCKRQLARPRTEGRHRILYNDVLLKLVCSSDEAIPGGRHPYSVVHFPLIFQWSGLGAVPCRPILY